MTVKKFDAIQVKIGGNVYAGMAVSDAARGMVTIAVSDVKVKDLQPGYSDVDIADVPGALAEGENVVFHSD